MRISDLVPLLTLDRFCHTRSTCRTVSLSGGTVGVYWKIMGRSLTGIGLVLMTAAASIKGCRRGSGAPSRSCALLVLALSGPSASAIAQPLPVALPSPAGPFAAHIADASRRFGIPGHWIRAVIRAESAGKARAVSPVGAMGLMQVMPDTWAELRFRHGLGPDPYDPHDNILAGTAYLREMWDRYGGVAAMLAAYNAGPGRYDEYLSAGRVLPAGTRAYVAALVPVLDGATSPGAPLAVLSPTSDWHSAPLFVVRDIGAAPAVALFVDTSSGNAHAIDIGHESGSLSVIPAQNGGTP